MKKETIQKVTIDELRSHRSESIRSIYRHGYYIASHSGPLDNQVIDLFSSSVRMTSVFFILCQEGEIEIMHNQKQYVLGRNSLMIGLPDAVVQINSSSHMKISSLLCQKEMLEGLHGSIDNTLIMLLLYVFNHPVIELTDDEVTDLQRTFSEQEYFAREEEDDAFTKGILESGIRILIYKICRMIMRRINRNDFILPDSSKYNYFRRFYILLSTEYKNHRSVSWYADCLHLSAKYFTSIIREVSGRTTIDWINDRVACEAKNLLLYSNMSISEIAYSLNFPNPSFFSKFFKNEVGVSPSEYRSL